jgi:glycosyltransferase involved in cell wall biosynthesis
MSNAKSRRHAPAVPPGVMKVLHVIPSISVSRGGPSVVMRTLAKSQAALGLEVHVATTDDNGPGRLRHAAGTSFVEDGVTYLVFRRQTRFYTFSLPLTMWFAKHARDYDVIHIHALFSYPSIAAALFARLAHVPYLVRPLGVLNIWGMQHRRPWLKRLSFRLMESRVLRNAAGVQYTSAQESAEAAQLGVKHISLLIPNPVDVAAAPAVRGKFRAAFPALIGKTMVLFLSRIDAKKGIDILLPAFARLRSHHPESVLVVAGDGDRTLLEGLIVQANQLGLGEGILWAGFLQGEMKRNALADTDVFVLPSYSENFGVAVVEAMGCGIPVIVSDQVGIHREIAEAEAGLVVECSVPSLEEALTRAVCDPIWRRKASTNALKLAGTFAPEIIASRLAEIYERIRAHHGQRAAA